MPSCVCVCVEKSSRPFKGNGYARLQVHEFLLAVNDDPSKFELLMQLCRQNEMLREMRSSAVGDHIVLPCAAVFEGF